MVAQGIADLAGSAWWRGGGGDFTEGARGHLTLTQGVASDTYFELGNSWHTPATTQSKNQIEKSCTDAQGIADLAGSTW